MENTVTTLNVISNSYRKEIFYITLNKDINVIEFEFKNSDLLKLLKTHVDQAKLNKETKTYQAPITNLNIERVEDFIKGAYATLGDIRQIFDFKFGVIKTVEKVEAPKFSFKEAISGEVSDIRPSIKDRADYRDIKEGELMDRNSKRGSEVKEVFTNGVIKIEDQKSTYKEIKELAVYRLVKDLITINVNNELVYFYNDKTKIYESSGIVGSISPQITNIMLNNGLENYTSISDVNSVVKSVENYLKADGQKEDLVIKYFNVNSDKGVVSMFICKNKDGKTGFRVVDACKENKAILNMRVTIDSKNIINEETGESWDGIEEMRENKFFYKFKTDRTQDIHTLYLDKLFASVNHYNVAKMYAGNILTGRKIAKFFEFIGDGDDGKTEWLEAFKEMYGIERTQQFKFIPSKGENFGYQCLLSNPVFAYVTEVDNNVFDEVMFKNLSGDRHVPIPVKNSYPRVIDTTTIQFMIVMNYKNIFRIPNIDRSMIRRICFVQAAKFDGVKILGIMNKLINGLYAPEIKKTFKPQRLEFFHWMLEGAVMAYDTNAFTETNMDADVYGQDVFDFNQEMIEIMAGSSQFLKDEEIEFLRDGSLTKKSHIMEYYLEYCEENSVQPKERMGTTKLIDSIIMMANNKYGYKFNERMRCKLPNGKLVDGLPIKFKHDKKAKENIFMTISMKAVARSKVLDEKEVEAKQQENKEIEKKEISKFEKEFQKEQECDIVKIEVEQPKAEEVKEEEVMEFDFDFGEELKKELVEEAKKEVKKENYIKYDDRIKELEELIKNEKDIKETNKLIAERNALVANKNMSKI